MRRVLLLVCIACKGDASKPEATPKPVTPDAAVAFDPKMIASRFLALRDDKGLGCLLERAPDTRAVLDVVAQVAPPIVTRIATFAHVERQRREGETPALDALADGVALLASVDDVDGLRESFAMIDKLGQPRNTQIEVYRARIGATSKESFGIDDRVSTIRELALAGDAKAAAMYDALPAGELASVSDATNVRALVALRRLDGVRVLLEKAKPERKRELVEAWLETEAHLGTPLKDPVVAFVDVLRALPPNQQAMSPTLIDMARRARRGPELAPLRALFAKTDMHGLHEAFYVDALLRGDSVARDEVAGLLPPDRRARLEALYTGPLDKALALEETTSAELAIIWTRWAIAGGEAPFAAKLEAAVCKPQKPDAPATPAITAKLAVSTKKQKPQMECRREDVIVRLVAMKEVLAETTLDAECHGACTPADKREGQRSLDRIRKAIDKGESSESELDYNFTDCYGTGYRFVRIDHVGERDVALVAESYPGPHDVVYQRHHVVLEVCGKLFVSEAFGELQLGRFEDAELHTQAAAGALEVVAASERFRGIVYRLHYPACPAAPVQQVVQVQ